MRSKTLWIALENEHHFIYRCAPVVVTVWLESSYADSGFATVTDLVTGIFARLNAIMPRTVQIREIPNDRY